MHGINEKAGQQSANRLLKYIWGCYAPMNYSEGSLKDIILYQIDAAFHKLVKRLTLQHIVREQSQVNQL